MSRAVRSNVNRRGKESDFTVRRQHCFLLSLCMTLLGHYHRLARPQTLAMILKKKKSVPEILVASEKSYFQNFVENLICSTVILCIN